MYHDFGFMGGSLGSAEGEKLARGFEFAMENNMPVVVVCRSGGARMQGTVSCYLLKRVTRLTVFFFRRGNLILDANGQGFSRR